jgi:hypothetical protein
MRRRRVALGIGVVDAFDAPRDLIQRDGQPERVTADFRATAVGGIFAGAADRHLHHHGGQRRNEHGDQDANETERVVVVTVAAKEESEIAKHGNGAGQGRGDRHS